MDLLKCAAVLIFAIPVQAGPVKRACQSVVVVEAGKTVSTGIVINGGDILTCWHSIAKADRVRVTFEDGQVCDGVVACADAAADVAVLAVPLKRPPMPIAATPPEQGDPIIAIGHPLGLKYKFTATVGIVSAVGREIEMPGNVVLRGLYQTDATINPGNSGGPLLNKDGELVGMNVAMHTLARGIAFAIPITDALKIAARRTTP